MLFRNLSPRVGNPVVVCSALTLLAVLAIAALSYAADKLIDARQNALIEDLKANCAETPDALVDQLRLAQVEFCRIVPPGMDHPLHQPCGLVAFDPNGFPEEFLKGLVYDVEGGSPVYTITVQENPKTREIHLYNGDDKPILTLEQENYDPLWLVKRFKPETYDARTPAASRAQVEEWLDPAHVEIELKLIPVEFVETFAQNTITSVFDVEKPVKKATLTGGGGSVMMMKMAQASTSIVVSAISRVSTNKAITVQYPDDFTNRLEIFTCADLRDPWSLIATNLSTFGTNEIQWTDTTAWAASLRFYTAANADEDSDGDGLVDGREQFMYKTCATNLDTDGDGLVDGLSGLVTTNSYPGGATTNGWLVEGELTWATGPSVFDTDGDGMGDGWEVSHGHNPTNENDPPSVSGTVFYTGHQTGVVHVVAVTDTGSWSTNAGCTLATPANYLIPHLEQTNFWIKAWVDTDGNALTNATEARGTYTNASIVITNRVTGKDITLADPDNDSDGLPDWWEVTHFGSITNQAGGGDSDGDQYTNQEEYEAGTDPGNVLSHPWNLSGTITYTGPQTGIVWVVACTEAGTWGWAQVATNATLGAYTITHLPPETNYWVRAWRDSNGDGVPPTGSTAWEAWGEYAGNPVALQTNATGIDITLADPDNDVDGLPDWWEVRYGLDPTAGGAGDALAWWKFDETAGTNAADSAGSNHGTLHGFATTGWVAGVVGNGLTFDGSNSYVEVADNASLKPGHLGLGLWIKPTTTYTNGKSATFLSKEDPTAGTGYSLGYTNGALRFSFQSGGTRAVAWPCALTAGVPVHVVAMYGGNYQRIYVNAQLRVETNYIWGMSLGDIAQGTNVLRLGATATGAAGNFFTGLLDDVRLTGEEWTTGQIHGVWELGADPDGDGLSNNQEFNYETNPNNLDTDGDGWSDYAELFIYGTNPNTNDTVGASVWVVVPSNDSERVWMP